MRSVFCYDGACIVSPLTLSSLNYYLTNYSSKNIASLYSQVQNFYYPSYHHWYFQGAVKGTVSPDVGFNISFYQITYVNAACPCPRCMSVSKLQVHSPWSISIVHANGPNIWSMPMVHSHDPCPWSMSIVHAYGPCLWFMSMVHDPFQWSMILFNGPWSISMVNAQGPRPWSMVHVHGPCTCTWSVSMYSYMVHVHVHTACSCCMSMSINDACSCPCWCPFSCRVSTDMDTDMNMNMNTDVWHGQGH